MGNMAIQRKNNMKINNIDGYILESIESFKDTSKGFTEYGYHLIIKRRENMEKINAWDCGQQGQTEEPKVATNKKIITCTVGDMMGLHQTQYVVLNHIVPRDSKVTIEVNDCKIAKQKEEFNNEKTL